MESLHCCWWKKFTCFRDLILDVFLVQNLTASLSPATSLGSEVVASSDLTHLSSITTSDEHNEGAAPTNQSRTIKSATGKLISIEAELVVKHLREAQLQIVNAADMDLQSKWVLDALVNLVVEEFIQLPEEKDQFNELTARKGNLLFLSFLLWILLVSVVFLFFCGSQRSFGGVIPTWKMFTVWLTGKTKLLLPYVSAVLNFLNGCCWWALTCFSCGFMAVVSLRDVIGVRLWNDKIKQSFDLFGLTLLLLNVNVLSFRKRSNKSHGQRALSRKKQIMLLLFSGCRYSTPNRYSFWDTLHPFPTVYILLVVTWEWFAVLIERAFSHSKRRQKNELKETSD